MIEFDRVQRIFPGGVIALDNLNLSINDGEIVTFLGPSGCGKTTCLRLIAGLDRPTQGTIRLNGQVVASASTWVTPEQRRIGMVFQSYALFPHLTVAQNIHFAFSKSDQASVDYVEELTEMLGLTNLQKRYPHELSGGQQQRVAVVRALATRPSVVLLDEPFSNLDANLKRQMRSELRRLLTVYEQTAIFVSHDPKDAFALADRIAVFSEGTIVQFDSPRAIYERPTTRFASQLTGPTNLIAGVCEDEGVRTAFGLIPLAGLRMSPSQRVELSVRPEGIIMDDHGTLTARVVETEYAGATYEVTLVADNQTMVTYCSPTSVPVIGSSVRLAVRQDMVHLVS